MSKLPRPCKVLLCGPFPLPIGGVSIHLQRLRQRLARDPAFEVRGVDESPRPSEGIFHLRSLRLLAYLRLLWWADVVHVHSSVPVFRALHVVLARLLGRRVVLTVHSHRPRQAWSHRLARLLCACSHEVIAVNDVIRQQLCERAHVIPAYIAPAPEEETVPSDLREWIAAVRAGGRQLIVSNAYKLVDFDGVDLYGCDLLLDIFDEPAIRARYALVFVVGSLDGGDQRFQAYLERIRARGLEGQVWLLHRAMPFAGLLQLCDVSVRATNTDGDALSIRESLYYGKRTLASDCVLRPAQAELFATRDAGALAAALLAPAQPVTDAMISFDSAIRVLYERLY